ncbi:BMP family ABC transporter substrate-binding protein [Nitratireductor mangrovi]|uniref:BMP family ABC transporter substrate-binding protein n=1 Tax=Nitratireductor mangrovi TaxID=2599600 RepID=A0A5B8L6C4_9HYPH|nr:BMP family ABC transporter substrate-binding protein [Nitratireductor mangrovi]QDZ03273.1 BMP family ABC transporter substrate-binding protein [Nitratireductor mangrovi]
MMKMTRRDILGYGGATGALVLAGGFASSARAQEAMKIAIVNSSPANEVGWSKQHELATKALKAEKGDAVSLTVLDSIFNPQDAERVFRQLASEGNQLIIGTSFSLGAPMHKVAPRFPDIAFEHCAGITTGKNIGVFDAKYHEGNYVSGVAAAHMTKSKKLGWVLSFPVPAILSPVNAFLQGARSVDPEITCNVIFLNTWYDPGKEKEAARALLSQGCDVIGAMTDTGVTAQASADKGAYVVAFGSDHSQFAPEHHLTACTFDWSSYYIGATTDVANGTWEAKYRWGGIAEGVIKMSPYSEVIPASVRDELKAIEQRIASGDLNPFTGEIKDQNGQVKVESGAVLSDEEIRGMDWLVEGMIGTMG